MLSCRRANRRRGTAVARPRQSDHGVGATLRWLGLAIAVSLVPLPAAAQMRPFLLSGDTIVPLRVRGNEVISLDLNDQGLIAGTYRLPSSDQYAGFLYRAGAFQPFTVPGATLTAVADLNNAGTVVGTYRIGLQPLRGFVLNGGTFTTLAVPGSIETNVTAVNDGGAVAGFFTGTDSVIRGYIARGGSYDIVSVPGAQSTFVTGINNAGAVTGYFGSDPTPAYPFFSLQPFVYSAGSYTLLDNPAAVGGGIALAINDRGDVVGYYTDTALRRRGFLYADGVFTPLGNPGNAESFAVALNNARQVVGYGTAPPEAFVFADGSDRFFTDPIAIQFTDINNGGQIVGLSGVATAGVPEPAIWLTCVLGFGAVGGGLRRVRRAAAEPDRSPAAV